MRNCVSTLLIGLLLFNASCKKGDSSDVSAHPLWGKSTDGFNILIVGIAPKSVDLSDPSLPKGLTAEDIQKGLDQTIAEIKKDGNKGELCMIKPDDSAEATVKTCLVGKRFDAVVIGAGIRVPAPNILLFENVMNAIHHYAPFAALAFNSTPEDSAKVAVRVLTKYKTNLGTVSSPAKN